MTAGLVVDAAALGVPLDQWLAFPSHTRRAVIAEHNERLER